MRASKKWLLAVGFLVCLAQNGFTQDTYPDTLYIPVVFYDYQAIPNTAGSPFENTANCYPGTNGNPEPCPGLVVTTLDIHRKPIPNPNPIYYGSNTYAPVCYQSIGQWFWPSGNNARATGVTFNPDSARWGGLIHPNSGIGSGQGEFISSQYTAGPLSNIVIYDSLPFAHKGKNNPALLGVYDFDRTDFFKLDGRGYGNQPGSSGHNYGFTMELHRKFTYRSDLTFNFRGDDDVWVFINGNRLIDLGGVHGPRSASFDLNNVPGLIPNQEYWIDFFYAERHTSGSNIQITSNIITAPPTQITLTTQSDSITAGTWQVIRGTVKDSRNRIRDDLSESIQWKIIGQISGDTIRPPNGDSVGITATRAWRWVVFEAWIANPANLTDTIRTKDSLFVKPSSAYQVNIESHSNVRTSQKMSLETLTLDSTTSSSEGLYAVIRDRFGNWVSTATSADWLSIKNPDSVVTASSGTHALDSAQGKVTKVTPPVPGSNKVRVWARGNDPAGMNPLFKDDIIINVSNFNYKFLRIVSYDNGQPLGPTFPTTTEDTTGLRVQASVDNINWTNIVGDWSANISTDYVTTPNANIWNFAPNVTGTGTITVTTTGNLKATQNVIVNPGKPAYVKLYRNGIDMTNRTFPAVSGDTLKLIARVYDRRNVELIVYGTTKADSISWSVNNGNYVSLLPGYGQPRKFLPRKVTPSGIFEVITATLLRDGIPITSSLNVTVGAGPANKIEIISDTITKTVLSSFGNNYSGADSVILYTAVFDANGNFVGTGFASNTSWASNTPAKLDAHQGSDLSHGQGIVKKMYAVADGSIIAISAAYTTNNITLRDTVFYTLITDTGYTRVNIATYNVATRRFDFPSSITVSDDSTLALYAFAYNSSGDSSSISMRWTVSGAPTGLTAPLTDLSSWAIAPTIVTIAPNKGTIRIQLGPTRFDTININVIHGLPASVRVYADTSIATPYSSTNAIPVIAGQTKPLVAKLFDYSIHWLRQYKDSTSYFNWIVTTNDGKATGTLTPSTGYKASFTPTKAGTYSVSVKYTGPAHATMTNPYYSMTFAVAADTAAKLIIQTDNDVSSLHEASRVDFQGADSIQYVYATLWDRYNNFVSFATAVNWNSLNSQLFTVSADPIEGARKGRIVRTGTTGNSRVVATHTTKSFLTDFVDVYLSDVVYDSLSIAKNSATFSPYLLTETLTLQTGADSTLTLWGREQITGRWQKVSGNWLYSRTTGVQNQLGTSIDFINFAPVDTSSGTMITTFTTLTARLNVKVGPGDPTRIVLVDQAGGNVAYAPLITVAAGQAVQVNARLYYQDIYLNTLESSLNPPIKWILIDPKSSTAGLTSFPNKFQNSVLTRQAYDTVSVIVKYAIKANDTLQDTLKIAIRPGAPTKLVLSNTFPASKLVLNDIDTARISSRSTSAVVYATLRDAYNNLCEPGYANPVNWGSLNTATVTVGTASFPGATENGAGEITKSPSPPSNLTRIWAYQSTQLTDTIYVKILPYSYDSLRIVDNNDVFTRSKIDATQNPNLLSIKMDETARLAVQGLVGSQGWELVTNMDVKWTVAPISGKSVAQTVGPVPTLASTWAFSPNDTGRGTITVSLPSDPLTVPSTLGFAFKPATPDDIVVTITTGAANLLAGAAIDATLQLRDNTGKPILDDSCYANVIFQDILGPKGTDTGFVVVGTDTIMLNKAPDSTSRGTVCFIGGKANVTFVLFNAPPNTPNTITVKAGSLKGSTPPFNLLPGQINELFVLYNGVRQGANDTIKFESTEGNRRFELEGQDRYGNIIAKDNPRLASFWSSTGTLDSIRTPQAQNFYTLNPASVTTDQVGNVIATATENPAVKAQVPVIVLGPRTQISNASTGDTDGNGLLDHIYLTFNKPIVIPDPINYDSAFTITYVTADKDTQFYRVTGISGTQPGDSVTSLVLTIVPIDTLKDNVEAGTQTKDIPMSQTAWTPDVTLHIPQVTEFPKTTTDSAGPVVWRVMDFVKNIDNRKQDEINITIGEELYINRNKLDDNNFNPSFTLDSLFNVYVRSSTGADSLLPNFFANINTVGVDVTDGKTIITFTMTNGNTLTANHSISLKPTQKTTDISTNAAETINVPVDAEVYGGASKLKAAPNPFPPTAQHEDVVFASELRGYISVKQSSNSGTTQNGPGTWAKNGGTAIGIDWIVPAGNISLKGDFKVFDIIGNLVYHKVSTSDLFAHDALAIESQLKGLVGQTVQIQFYWNGYNDRKMPVSAGVYRSTLNITFVNEGKTRFYTGTLAVKRSN